MVFLVLLLNATPSIIGNRHIHALTSFPNNQQALRVELTRNKGENPIVLHYRNFHVGDKQNEYKLTISEYDGLPGRYWHCRHASRAMSCKEVVMAPVISRFGREEQDRCL